MPELMATVHGASEIVVGPNDFADRTPDPSGPALDRREDAAVAIVDGDVAAVGPDEAVRREYPPENARRTVDATGKTILPGFVDSHTHALFAGDRSDEFAAKLRGKSYREIMAEGGGILRTVRATHEADDETLLGNLIGHLDAMLAHGTTTVEVKSGYGLNTDAELRMLDVIDRADDRHPVDVVPTFMGAHAVPESRGADDYVREVVDEQIPAVERQGIAEFCDAFCEADVFSVEQSRRVLTAGAAAGLTPKVHAEEFERIGGTALAAELGAASADHLLRATEEDAVALAESGVVPVLLPGTALSLGGEYADARAFLDAGAPVALATDFNPNCHSRSPSMSVALGCLGMNMTPAEAIVGATRNGALALDRDGRVGTLREGAPADAIVVDAPDHVHVPYTFGENLVETVLKGGEIVRGG